MNYVGEVAELFRSRFGEMNILGPMDYVMIAEWEKRGIPVVVVEAAIDEVLKTDRDALMPLVSVDYFNESIIKRFRAWLQADPAEA